MSSKSENEVKLKNRLWRRLTKRVNRKNIMRIATIFRRLFARAFCMGVGGDKQATAEVEHANEERETPTEDGSSDDDNADLANTDRTESSTADGDGSISDTSPEGEMDTQRTEEEYTDTPESEMEKAPVFNGTRVAALRHLQRQIFMDDTFTTAKPPLPPRRSREPDKFTRHVHCTRSLDRFQEVVTAAPAVEAEVVSEKQEVTTLEDGTEKPVEEMTDEDIDDIIDEILRC